MRWFLPTLIMGIAALGLFAASWAFRIAHWPGASILRYAALGAFAVGVFLLLLYNVSKLNEKEPEEESFEDWLNKDD
ncbi:MAG: hypothetical protein AAGN35_08300 [Bacteroidota bacterium]